MSEHRIKKPLKNRIAQDNAGGAFYITTQQFKFIVQVFTIEGPINDYALVQDRYNMALLFATKASCNFRKLHIGFELPRDKGKTFC